MIQDVPQDWQSNIQDEEYLIQIWKPEFIQVDEFILLKSHYDLESFQQWLQKPVIRKKLENTINHIHLSDITPNVELQQKIGEKLQTNWQQTLKDAFPGKRFEINLVPAETEWELQMWTAE